MYIIQCLSRFRPAHGLSLIHISARIDDGDIIIIRKQDIVENGEIAVVIVNGDDATVKRYHRDGNIVTLTPQSYNPEHTVQIYSLKDVPIRIFGKVVEVRRSFE